MTDCGSARKSRRVAALAALGAGCMGPLAVGQTKDLAASSNPYDRFVFAPEVQVREGAFVEGTGQAHQDGVAARGACATVGCAVTPVDGFIESDTQGEFFVGVTGSRIADNFSVSTTSVNEICFWGSYSGNAPATDSFTLTFYADADNAGGT